MTDLRDIERTSIRDFVLAAAEDGYLSGRVLDYGCGKQPYRDIVEAAGGEYEAFDRANFPANVSGNDVGDDVQLGDWRDAVLCTQVIQYERHVEELLAVRIKNLIRPEGHLVMTYPTNWPEVEAEDLWRFTKAGMERLLITAGFEIVHHQRRAEAYLRRPDMHEAEADLVVLGYGVIARA